MPNDYPQCLDCVVFIMWCAFGALWDVGLAERPTPCRFTGTVHVSFPCFRKDGRHGLWQDGIRYDHGMAVTVVDQTEFAMSWVSGRFMCAWSFFSTLLPSWLEAFDHHRGGLDFHDRALTMFSTLSWIMILTDMIVIVFRPDQILFQDFLRVGPAGRRCYTWWYLDHILVFFCNLNVWNKKGHTLELEWGAPTVTVK